MKKIFVFLFFVLALPLQAASAVKLNGATFSAWNGAALSAWDGSTGVVSGGGGGASPVITSYSPGSVHAGYNGDVGFRFVPTANITVSELGRWKISGNSETHTVKIWDSAGTSVLASVSVDVSTGTDGAFVYATLGSPLALTSGTTYWITTAEQSGAHDQFYDERQIAGNITVNADIGTISSAYSSGGAMFAANGGYMYGPPNFKYTKP